MDQPLRYSEAEAVRRLQDLDNSQASVESTSAWFLGVQEMAKEVVKLWFKEFRRAPPKKKIAFLHLANDVIQNGVVAAPQYGKLFEPVLPTAFKETAKVQKHSVRAAVAHLLIVWAARRIYSKSFLRQLRFICQRAVAEADTPDASEETKRNIIAASPFAFSFTAVLLNANNPAAGGLTPNGATVKGANGRRKRHHSSRLATPSMSFAPNNTNQEPPLNSISAFREELARELETEAMPPPQTSELIELLESLQHSAASADAATRRAIAQFPPEVSDSSKAMDLIEDAAEAERIALASRISVCSEQLGRYNTQLEEESNRRNQLSLKLRAYQMKLRERMKEAEAEIETLKKNLEHGQELEKELVNHMSSLPDLNLLPDMTAGLDPLPTVGDLFG